MIRSQLPLGVVPLLSVAALAGCASPPPSQSAAGAKATPPRCAVVGAPVVVAPNVYADDVHVAPNKSGGFTVSVLDGVAPCLNVDVSPRGELSGTVLGPCPKPADPGKAKASSEYSTYLARQVYDGSGRPRLLLGVVTFEAPHSFFGAQTPGQEHVYERRIGMANAGESDPALANYGDNQFALAWVQDDTVRIQPVGGWASLLGEPISVPVPNSGTPGTPAIAFNGRGQGLVTFAAQTESGHDVVAAPIVCTR